MVRAAHSEKYANGGLTLTAYLLTPALKLPVRIFILVKCSPYPACAYTSLNLKSESLQTTSAVSVQKTAVCKTNGQANAHAACGEVDLSVSMCTHNMQSWHRSPLVAFRSPHMMIADALFANSVSLVSMSSLCWALRATPAAFFRESR